MTTPAVTVTGGVDTHKHTHYAAAVSDQGRLLGHREFPATDPGYRALLAWMRGHGQVAAIGVESTGSFGAALTRALTAAGEQVVEVNRPSALYMITIVRMRRHQPTLDYVERRTAEGLSKREIIRCLKRYIAREIYASLPRQDPSSPPPAATC